MIKIKVSYETPEEMRKVMSLLQPLVAQCKVKKATEGKYKRIYLTTKK